MQKSAITGIMDRRGCHGGAGDEPQEGYLFEGASYHSLNSSKEG